MALQLLVQRNAQAEERSQHAPSLLWSLLVEPGQRGPGCPQAAQHRLLLVSGAWVSLGVVFSEGNSSGISKNENMRKGKKWLWKCPAAAAVKGRNTGSWVRLQRGSPWR